MTEDEAKTKWCPFAGARLIEWRKEPDKIVNQMFSITDVPTPLCVASACMAWRTTSAGKHYQEGYCGLARSLNG